MLQTKGERTFPTFPTQCNKTINNHKGFVDLVEDEDSLGIMLDPEEKTQPLTEENRRKIFHSDQKKKKTPSRKKTLLNKVSSPPTPSSFNPSLNCPLKEEKYTQEKVFSFSIKHLNNQEYKKTLLETPEKRSKVSFRDRLLLKNDYLLSNEEFPPDYVEEIQEIAGILRKLSRLSYNEIEKGLFNPKDFETSAKRNIKGIIAIIGVDPASLNCGFTLLFSGGIIEIGKNSFRQKSHAPDLGCVEICEVIKKFIEIIDRDYIMWGIENQMAALKKKNDLLENPRLSNLEKESYYLEQYAVQFFFTALIPRERICIVSPSALKKFFGFEEQSDPNKRYEYNKKKAIELGKEYVSEYIRKRIIDLTGRDDPDIYDAILVARYIYETIIGVPSFSKKKKMDEREEKKKKRKIEKGPRRRKQEEKEKRKDEKTLKLEIK